MRGTPCGCTAVRPAAKARPHMSAAPRAGLPHNPLPATLSMGRRPCTQTEARRVAAGSHCPADGVLRRVPPPGAVLHAHQQRAGQGCGTAHAAPQHRQAPLLFQQPLLPHTLHGCWCALPHACDMLSQPQHPNPWTVAETGKPVRLICASAGSHLFKHGAWGMGAGAPSPVRCVGCQARCMACKLISLSIARYNTTQHACNTCVLRVLKYALGSDRGMYVQLPSAWILQCRAKMSFPPKQALGAAVTGCGRLLLDRGSVFR